MTSDGRLTSMKNTVWKVWNNCCGNVYQTIQPTWDSLREKAWATGEQTKKHLKSLHTACVEQKKFIQDKLDTLSGHSSAGRAIVTAIHVMAMLFLITVAIECAYHFRPLYWKIVELSFNLLYLVVMLLIRFTGMVLMSIGFVAAMNFVFGVILALTLRSWFMEVEYRN